MSAVENSYYLYLGLSFPVVSGCSRAACVWCGCVYVCRGGITDIHACMISFQLGSIHCMKCRHHKNMQPLDDEMWSTNILIAG